MEENILKIEDLKGQDTLSNLDFHKGSQNMEIKGENLIFILENFFKEDNLDILSLETSVTV